MKTVSLRFPEGREKALTFSYDDGAWMDRRLVEIFNRYHMKATFNLNTGMMPEESPEGTWNVGLSEISTLYRGHEVAVHTLTHPFLEQLPVPETVRQIFKDRENLEARAGYPVRGMAYPYGTYNENVIRAAKDCGIVYSRTAAATGNFSIPQDWMTWTGTCHHDDERLFDLADRFLNYRVGVHNASPYLFYVWGHSFEFEHKNNWERIERFCEKTANRNDVWYATNIEIYDYIEAYRALHFACDLSFVSNPTSVDVWITLNDEKTVKVPAGAQISLL